MNRTLYHAAFAAGLTALLWVGLGYLDSNPLALAITALIALFYLLGALDLHRFRQATSSLATALTEASDAMPALEPWLARVHPSLRNAVRRRIEGEPAGLAGPAMAPYLAGLLVLLGMLGTFVGMILTLRGTGLALDGAADLQAVRNTLVAPVKGLGLAFGTSVAGVAASAALGLLSALARRERLLVAQSLDARIATTLRPFSGVHRREASLKLLQGQAELAPVLADSLRSLMQTIERQSEQSNARLLASQEQFQARTEAAFLALASSVERSLQQTLADGTRAAGETMAPIAERAMSGVARESALLHQTLAEAAQRQLDALSTRLETNATRLAAGWQASVAELAGTFEQRSAALLASVAQGQSDWQREAAAAAARLAQDTAQVQARMADTTSAQLDGVARRLDETAQQLAASWQAGLAQQQRVSEQLCNDTSLALSSAATAFGQQATGLLQTMEQAQAEQQVQSSAREAQRIAAMTQAMEAMAASLHQEWQQAGAQTLAHQQQICETMDRTARDITAQSEAHAKATVAEIAALLQAASEAPRAAAQVIAELRLQLSDSMARDNSLLDERARILATLGTLLDTVQQAATEQRGAIDALVSSSAERLDRAVLRFGEEVDAQAGKLALVAGQVNAGAIEVASLGEAFGAAVQLFGHANDKLVDQLQRIDGALGKSLARSDEQLAYYVAQAREVIDLSLMSQKQIIEDLQRLSHRSAATGALAA